MTFGNVEPPARKKEDPSAGRQFEVEKLQSFLQGKIDPLKATYERALEHKSFNDFLSEKNIFHRLVQITNPPNSGEVLQPNMKFTIDFHNNKVLERQVSLADVMPPAVRKVTIQGKRGTFTGERKGITGEFYAENGKRLTVFTGTEVTVDKLGNPPQEPTADQIAEYTGQKQFRGIKDSEIIVQKALEKGIDPNLILALRRTENGKEGKEFGVLLEGVDNFDLQLQMALKIIGRYEGRFAGLYNLKPPVRDKNGQYTPEFLAYFSSTYAPIGAENDPTNLNQNHLSSLLNMYAPSRPEYQEKSRQFLEEMQKENLVFSEVLKKVTITEFINSAKKYNGTRYHWGGEDEQGIDCSGLVIAALRDLGAIGRRTDASAASIFEVATHLPKETVGERGDLIFWKRSQGITHVGIVEEVLPNGEYKIFDSGGVSGKGVGERSITFDPRVNILGRIPHIQYQKQQEEQNVA